jgi:hypothetical protein
MGLVMEMESDASLTETLYPLGHRFQVPASTVLVSTDVPAHEGRRDTGIGWLELVTRDTMVTDL